MPTRCLSRRQWASEVSLIVSPSNVILPASGLHQAVEAADSAYSLPEPLGPMQSPGRSPLAIEQLIGKRLGPRPKARQVPCLDSVESRSIAWQTFALRWLAFGGSQALSEAARSRNGAGARLRKRCSGTATGA